MITPIHLRELYTQFELALEREQQALIHRDLDALLCCVESKQQLVEQLSAAQLQLAPVFASNQAPAAKRDPVHTQIRDLAARCRELNLVNGRLVQRSRHCAQELLRVMQGTPNGPLYGADGTTASNANSSALALA